MKKRNINIPFVKVNSVDYASQASVGINKKRSYQTGIKRSMMMRQFSDGTHLVDTQLFINDADFSDSVSYKSED
ncbi:MULTISPECIES: hypothetical protein [unclassified Virgibacillus]|uniref:hypothetical protein n=1 Tax=unclassified Virgibacillus TaxID=2620237 RepID=UPI0024DE86DA|nr:hypothetical protein [Virgibacillus sp. LDC-1]